MSDPANLGPKPTTITGGCLCAALRYTVTLPPSHDFPSSALTCQCTQCRKQSGALFVPFHRVPGPLRWSSGPRPPPALKEFGITAAAKRGICTNCGSWLYYRSEGQEEVSLCVGTLDEHVLIGEKGDGDGFGRALVNGLGGHEWCANEIPGVTDDIPLLNKGQRNRGSSSEGEVAKPKL